MNILIVEDNPLDAKILSKMILTDPQFKVKKVDTLSAGLDRLKQKTTDLVLLDLNLPDSSDIMTFHKVYESFPNVPVVILSGQDDNKTVMEAMRLGAQDYFVKGKMTKSLLLRTLKYSVERNRSEVLLREKNKELEVFNHKLEEMIQATNQMAVEAEVSAMELNQIFNTTADAMWILDNKFKIQKINDAFLYFLGRTRKETVNKECREIFRCSFCGGPDCLLKLVENSIDRVEYEVSARDGNGTETPFLMTATPFKTVTGEIIGIIANYTDITNLKNAETLLKEKNRELERLSNIDGLTRIANRRKFDESLKMEWKRLARDKKPLSLILCDIDFFKLYNDHYGHQAGDDCLITVAGAIERSLKRPADLAARYGGEEFGVILPDTHGEGAFSMANLIRKNIYDINVVHERSTVDPYVTLSLGVSEVIPNINNTPEELLLRADKALYKAKETGRNQAVFKPFHEG